MIRAQVRHEDGTKAAVRTRRAGRTPGILFSLPGESSILVSMESKHVKTLVRQSDTTQCDCANTFSGMCHACSSKCKANFSW